MLLFAIALAAIPPFLLFGVGATKIAQDSITKRVRELHVQKADNLATFVDIWLSGQIQSLELLTRHWKLSSLTDQELLGFQRLIYQQFDDINIVSVFGKDGVELAPILYSTVPTGNHEKISQARLNTFRNEISLPSEVTIGTPYLPPNSDNPVVQVIIPNENVFLAVEYSLSRLVFQLSQQIGPELEIAMLDSNGRIFLRGGAELVRSQNFLIFLNTSRADLRYSLEDDTEVLAALARVEETGWLAVVAEPSKRVESASREILRQSAYFGLVGVALAIVISIYFTAILHKPVIQLRDAAKALEHGALGKQVPTDSLTEVRQLGEAFNSMSIKLKHNQDMITKQQAEIEAFNHELQDRVKERTKELEEAQARLLESGKLAAVAELGAGLAHELNNPLSSILGISQLLKHKKKNCTEEPMLESLEAEAIRCTGILKTLLTITEQTSQEGSKVRIDLHRLLPEAICLASPSFKQKGVNLIYKGQSLFVEADSTRLLRALSQLLASLRALTDPGSQLIISTERLPNISRVAFFLDKAPVKLKKDDWFASGMSIWVARRILAEQGGQLKEPSSNGPRLYHLDFPEA